MPHVPEPFVPGTLARAFDQIARSIRSSSDQRPKLIRELRTFATRAEKLLRRYEGSGKPSPKSGSARSTTASRRTTTGRARRR